MRQVSGGPIAGCVTIALVLCASASGAQTQRATIRGVARDSAGHPIAAVQLNVDGTDIRAASDATGAYVLPGVWPGPVIIVARHLGFTPESAHVVTEAGRTLAHDIVLREAAAVLDVEEVNADPTRGKMGPFNRRRARGVGSFITRDEIERRQPGSLSEMLRYLPGVSVTQKMAGEAQPVHMQRSVATTTNGECVVRLYVDGHPYENGNVDDFSPNSVEGVEVYRSAAEIPADFRTRDATCGVIAIWTRDPERARQRP